MSGYPQDAFTLVSADNLDLFMAMQGCIVNARRVVTTVAQAALALVVVMCQQA